MDYATNQRFLSSRGIYFEDIFNYNLLTAHWGKYKGRLIIPLMENNVIRYFVSREMLDKGKYLNPLIDRKDLLLYYLGTENKMRLYIVEGAFDGISLNKLGRSVLMLLGSSISEVQLEKIEKIGFKEAVVFLDGDIPHKAVQMCKKISCFGIPTKVIMVSKDDDPNSIYVDDRQYLHKLLSTPKELTFQDTIEMALRK